MIRLFATGLTSLWAGGAGAAVRLPASGPQPQQSRTTTPPLLPLFPLPLVLFPETQLILHIFEERYKRMIRDCLLNRWEFGILLAGSNRVEPVGCTAAITEIIRSYRSGEMDILVEGRRRFELSRTNRDQPYLRGEVEFFDDDESDAPVDLLQEEARQLHGRLIELLRAKDPALNPPEFSTRMRYLSFQIMASVPADHPTKQRLLTLRSEHDRLVQVILHLQQVIDVLEKGPEAVSPEGRV
jgi:Lon protease-like protein